MPQQASVGRGACTHKQPRSAESGAAPGRLGDGDGGGVLAAAGEEHSCGCTKTVRATGWPPLPLRMLTLDARRLHGETDGAGA
mmetsp:Transcript_21021/g.54836  ORF Transcript_21021/g.54836 Transcript_21021/m.54836 type:complete len:83 (+) Transcript_21021:929-1177(+)|eukprot:1160028-Pelagomonas_calceolata.AAC.2